MRREGAGKIRIVYEERLSSTITTGLFAALMLIFASLFAWRVMVVGLKVFPLLFLILSLVFLFYSINYKTLLIRITDRYLLLRFGIFTWQIPLGSIKSCALDEVLVSRVGGAGIHFMFLDKRYRANYNFLEHPRVLLRFKQRQGLVWDASFSTRQPQEVMRCIQEFALKRTGDDADCGDGGSNTE